MDKAIAQLRVRHTLLMGTLLVVGYACFSSLDHRGQSLSDLEFFQSLVSESRDRGHAPPSVINAERTHELANRWHDGARPSVRGNAIEVLPTEPRDESRARSLEEARDALETTLSVLVLGEALEPRRLAPVLRDAPSPGTQVSTSINVRWSERREEGGCVVPATVTSSLFVTMPGATGPGDTISEQLDFRCTRETVEPSETWFQDRFPALAMAWPDVGGLSFAEARLRLIRLHDSVGEVKMLGLDVERAHLAFLTPLVILFALLSLMFGVHQARALPSSSPWTGETLWVGMLATTSGRFVVFCTVCQLPAVAVGLSIHLFAAADRLAAGLAMLVWVLGLSLYVQIARLRGEVFQANEMKVAAHD